MFWSIISYLISVNMSNGRMFSRMVSSYWSLHMVSSYGLILRSLRTGRTYGPTLVGVTPLGVAQRLWPLRDGRKRAFLSDGKKNNNH